MSKSIRQYWNFSNMAIRSTKTGHKTGPRTNRKILWQMNQDVITNILAFFSIQPSEVQKPETGQKTGPRATGKILCANEPV